MRVLSRFVAATFVMAAAASGCSDQPLGPKGGTPQFDIVSGNNQVGPPNTELPDPLVVRVTNGGVPVPGAAVNFVVTSGGGSMWAGTVLTNSDGYARDYFTLGSSSPQIVEVREIDATGAKR